MQPNHLSHIRFIAFAFCLRYSMWACWLQNDVSSDLAAITGVAQSRVYDTLPEIENKPDLAKGKRASSCSAAAMKLPCHTTSSESNRTTITRVPVCFAFLFQLRLYLVITD